LQRALDVQEAAERLRANADYILQDLDRARTPRLRSVLDDALKLARDIEVMTVLSAFQPAEED
jgi:hypothetical protein